MPWACDDRIAAAADTVAELEEHRVLGVHLVYEAVGDAFGRGGLSRPDVAVENHERILFGHESTNLSGIGGAFW
jgi:hypothetical protein